MLPTKTLFAVSCALIAFGQVNAHPRQHAAAMLERRARTITVTETQTQTEMVTETETVTADATCMQTDDGSSIDTATASFTPAETPTKTPKPGSTAETSPESTNDVSLNGKCYKVSGVGSFAIKKSYDFTSGALHSDLQISDYNVPDRAAGNPWNHGFKPSNVFVSNGLLNLIVPGKQNPSKDPKKAIYGGEIYTSEGNILYGSFRTRAIFDDTPGTCQGIFSYHDDSSEIDIEYMGNSSSTANPSPAKPPVFWYTNQPGNKPNNQVTGTTPTDVASAIHEYRIDWTKAWTKFYIDGVLQKTLTGDVPQVGSQWVWNNWANGSPYWSTGPPLKDNVLKIESITMYYNLADGATC